MADDGVVFRRGHASDDGSDIWDDTALIKAYDHAISAVKEQLAASQQDDQTVQTSEKDGSVTIPDQKKKKKGRRRHKDKGKKDREQEFGQWHVGSHCRAIFTEDGEIYEAVITSIDPITKTCVVRYLGYGNEEKHHIDDLLTSSEGPRPGLPAGLARGHTPNTSNMSVRGSESESERDSSQHMDWAGGSPRVAGASSKTPGEAPPTWPFPSASSMFPPPPAMPSSSMPMPPMFPPMPGPVPGPMPGMFPSWPGAPMSSLSGMPHIPPPPLSDLDQDVGDDKTALYSMLMSWYMSGYHTGYYQGLKQGKSSGRTPQKDKNR